MIGRFFYFRSGNMSWSAAWLLPLAALALLAPPVRALDDDDEGLLAQEVPAAVSQALRELGEDIPRDDLMLADGLLADRSSRQVLLFAVATGLGPKDVVEFILIGPQSHHDYEALAVTFAEPSVIAQAIEFIGVPRGRPAMSHPLDFWPKGERVKAFVASADEGPGAGEEPLEQLVFDKARERPLPATGLVYTGSLRENGEFTADRVSPGSIISTYNERTTVFDLPHRAGQSDVYERFAPNPERLLRRGQLLHIRLRPEERPDGRPRVERYRLQAAPDPSTGASGLAGVAPALERLDDGADERPGEFTSIKEVFAFLRARVEAGFDPYVQPSFAESLTLARARAFSAALEEVEGPGGLRIMRPPEGQIYYRAFNPPEIWRARRDRPGQPRELLFEACDQALSGWRTEIVEIKEHWPDDVLRPQLETVRHSLPEPGQVPAKLEEIGPGLPVLLVFAPPEIPISFFMPVIRSLSDSHPTVYVFTGEPLDKRDEEVENAPAVE